MTRIYFYAGPEDNRALREKLESLGLRLYKALCSETGLPVEQDPERYHGYVSFLPAEDLHPVGGPAREGRFRLSDAVDPLMYWHKSYTIVHDGERYIIHGHLSWHFDDAARPDQVAAGKRYFGQLSRWIRSSWPPVRKRDICRGPQAQRMIQFESYFPRSLPPGTRITYVEIPGRQGGESAAKRPADPTGSHRDEDAMIRPRVNSRWRARGSWLLRFVALPIILLGAALAIMIWADSL